MNNYRISITIDPVNSYSFCAALEEQGFKLYQIDEAISEDFQPITDDKTLARLSIGRFDPSHGTIIKAIYNSHKGFPSIPTQPNFPKWLASTKSVKKFSISMDKDS